MEIPKRTAIRRAVLLAAAWFLGLATVGFADVRLELTDGIDLAYPSSWSVLPAQYASLRQLVNVPAGEQRSGRATAWLTITTDARSDHQEALQRLADVAREQNVTPTYLNICGWPALQRRHLAPVPQPGDLDAPGEEPAKSMRISTAIAAGRVLIRLEGFLAPGAPAQVADEVERVSRAVRCAVDDVPEDTQREIDELESQSPAETPPPSTLPRASAGEISSLLPLPELFSHAGVPQQPQSGVGEIELAVSPDGQNILMAANSGFSNSTDGGLTFTFQGGIPLPPGFFARNGDPSVGWGPSGAFYFAYIAFPTGTNGPPASRFTCSTTVARSTNNANSFTAFNNATLCDNTGATAPACFPDQHHIAVDRVNTSGGLDQVYSVWRNFSGGNCDTIAGPVISSIVCSQDNGVNWTAAAPIEANAEFPRITVGQDGFVYVVYHDSGNNIRLNKYSSCANGLVQQPMFPTAVTTYTDVACPVPGLDRCNNGNRLSSWTVAVDETNANHVYVAYATNTGAGNEDVMLIDSTDGGVNWGAPVRVNTNTTGVRFMPWVCAENGSAFVTWYDRRAAVGGATNDLTDYYCRGVSGSGAGLTVGTEVNVSVNPDPMCASGWPCAPRATQDSESCTIQPQLAGRCMQVCGTATVGDSNNVCDFSDGGCPMGETCCVGRGCPKYGDYNGNACAAGRVYTAWSSATAPPGLPNPGGLAIFTDIKLATLGPDLSISKSASPDPVVAGTNLTYTITVTNDAVAAFDVKIDEVTPPNTTFVSVSAFGFTCTNPAVGGTGLVSCTLPFLAANAMASLTLTVNVDPSVPEGATITNTATASSADVDPVPGNDSAMATVDVIAEADLAITKNATPDPVLVGGVLTYTIEVANFGPSDAVNVVVSESIPNGTAFAFIIPPAGWVCVTPALGDTGTVTCTTPSFAAGAMATLIIRVVVKQAMTIQNIVAISSDTTDPNDDNNESVDEAVAERAVPVFGRLGALTAVVLIFVVVAWSLRKRRADPFGFAERP